VSRGRANWIDGLVGGLILGALLLLFLRVFYLLLRAAWDYRRELTPAVPLLVDAVVTGESPSITPAIQMADGLTAVVAAALMARRFWSLQSRAAGRKERFLAKIRRAWPTVASRSVGGRGRAWRTVQVSPSKRGVDLLAHVPVGFSVQDLVARSDAIAAAYAAAGCSVARDPTRADLAHLSLDWRSRLPVQMPGLQTWP
jgi:hypothetical protein